MVDRLAMLQQMAKSRPEDPFPRYGLAMEYRRLGRSAEARAAFRELAERHPDYVPTYLMFGNLLVDSGDRNAAAEIYRRGIEAAGRTGDAHALGELQAALTELG